MLALLDEGLQGDNDHTVGGTRFRRMRFAGNPEKLFSYSRAGVALLGLIVWGACRRLAQQFLLLKELGTCWTLAAKPCAPCTGTGTDEIVDMMCVPVSDFIG